MTVWQRKARQEQHCPLAGLASIRHLNMIWKDSLVCTSVNENKIIHQHTLSLRHSLYQEKIRILSLIKHCLVCLNDLVSIFIKYFTVLTTSVTLPSASGGKLRNCIIYNSLLQRYADNIIVSLFLKLWMDYSQWNQFIWYDWDIPKPDILSFYFCSFNLSLPALNLHPGHIGRLRVFEEHHIKA